MFSPGFKSFTDALLGTDCFQQLVWLYLLLRLGTPAWHPYRQWNSVESSVSSCRAHTMHFTNWWWEWTFIKHLLYARLWAKQFTSFISIYRHHNVITQNLRHLSSLWDNSSHYLHFTSENSSERLFFLGLNSILVAVLGSKVKISQFLWQGHKANRGGVEEMTPNISVLTESSILGSLPLPRYMLMCAGNGRE